VRQRGLKGSFWPSRVQQLVLETVLGEGEGALRAWRELGPLLDIENLGPGTYPLMGLLYRQLERLGIDCELVPRLRGIYRRSWYLGQVQLERVVPTLETLEEADLRVIVVGGWALAAHHYRDLGVRPVDQLELLVPTEAVSRTIEVAQAAGWTLNVRVTRSTAGPRSGARLGNDAGDTLTVLSDLFREFVVPGVKADDLWQAAVPTDLAGVPVRVLSPADELLNVCLSGARAATWPSVVWVADAVTLVRSSCALDWGHVLRQAHHLRATLRLRDALAYLECLTSVAIPTAVTEELRCVRVTRRETLAHRAAASRSVVLGEAPESITRFLRATASDTVPRALVALPEFLRHEWGLEPHSPVLRPILVKVIRRASLASHRAASVVRSFISIGQRVSGSRR
jgi:Uncharacterised nucleotidyltransferase